jgi:benzoate-CoA ligase
MHLSHADHSTSPPRVEIPRDYNAAHDLLARNAGRAGKPAFVDSASGTVLTYGDLEQQAHRFANALRARGVQPEARVLVAMLDTPEWPVVFLGCILAGVVPVAANTLLTTSDFEFMLRDSRAQALFVSTPLLATFDPILSKAPALKFVAVAGGEGPDSVAGMVAAGDASPVVAPTCSDDACFWLYSSGSTGTPKGTVHLHSHLVLTAELYGRAVLGIREDDVVYSAAKLFFAYGLGNALTFPMSVGATTILLPSRPTPADVFGVLKKHRPTIFYGVPTLFAALLADPARPSRDELNLRVCTSAGEALPADIGKRWTADYGCEILDGIGSTEMLSNRPGQVRYGTTGQAVPGYRLRIVDDEGRECADGEIGELQISGPTSALMYWNNRSKTKATFAGEWTRSGDKYTRDADGYYTYGGRSDDMLKVGGIYVSPFEVEASLMTHPAVLEAAVIGVADSDQLVKPKAYVVL